MYKRIRIIYLTVACLLVLFVSCRQKSLPNQEMIDLLKEAEKYNDNPANVFAPEAIIRSCDSILHSTPDQETQMKALHTKAGAFLNLGQEQKAIDIYQNMLTRIPPGYLDQRLSLMTDM